MIASGSTSRATSMPRPPRRLEVLVERADRFGRQDAVHLGHGVHDSASRPRTQTLPREGGTPRPRLVVAVTTDPLSAPASAQGKPLLTIKPRRSWLPDQPTRAVGLPRADGPVRGPRHHAAVPPGRARASCGWSWCRCSAPACCRSCSAAWPTSHAPPGIPYFVFTLAGMVAWTAFSLVTIRASGVAAWPTPQLVGKVYFPRLLLPLSTVLSTLVDVGVSLALLVVLLVTSGVRPGLGVITFPIWFLAVLALALGDRPRCSGRSWCPTATSSTSSRSASSSCCSPARSPTRWRRSRPARRLCYELNPLTGLLEGHALGAHRHARARRSG